MPTAFAGAVGEEVLTTLLADLEDLRLSPVEQQRLAVALPAAFEEAQRRIDQGETVNETLGTPMKTGRRTGEAVLEAGFLAAARAHDDRKAEFIGTLIGGVPFERRAGFGRVDTDEALHLVDLACQLSYRQMVLIGLVYEGCNRDYRDDFTWMVHGPVLLEAFDLHRRGVLGSEEGTPIAPVHMRWSQLFVTDVGVTLYRLMGLASLDHAHKQQVLETIDHAYKTP
jgi:hypothetical protein